MSGVPAAGDVGRAGRRRRSTRRCRCSSARARSTTATTASTWSRHSRSNIRFDRRAGRAWPATSRCPSSDRRGSSWSTRARTSRRTSGGAFATVPLTDPPNHVGYFHATYRDHAATRSAGMTSSCSTRREAEGGGDWTGSFVGTSFIFSHNAVLNTLEGDPRFFFDDSRTPQAQGTGTEEWGGGGDYWGGRNMTLPFAGHPIGAGRPEEREERRGQDRVGVPLPARRPDALRQERPHPPGARRHQRVDRALRDRHLLVRPARARRWCRPTSSQVGDAATARRPTRYGSPDASAP